MEDKLAEALAEMEARGRALIDKARQEQQARERRLRDWERAIKEARRRFVEDHRRTFLDRALAERNRTAPALAFCDAPRGACQPRRRPRRARSDPGVGHLGPGGHRHPRPDGSSPRSPPRPHPRARRPPSLPQGLQPLRTRIEDVTLPVTLPCGSPAAARRGHPGRW